MANRARAGARSHRKPTIPGAKDWVPPPLPESSGVMAAVLSQVFAELDVGVSVWLGDVWWHPIHRTWSVTAFEREHGGQGRGAHNRRCLSRATRLRASVVGQYAGFRDLFVPIVDGSRIRGVLVAGPFSTARPTSGDLLEQWYEFTGTRGHLELAAFSSYVSAALSTLTLDSEQTRAFESLMTCFARLLVARGAAKALAAEAEAARRRLVLARLPERMWNTARRLVDDRAVDNAVPLDHGEMAALGLERTPQHVIAALLVGRDDDEPIDARLRRDAFQRACAAFAHRRGHMLAGPIGDQGVFLLVDHRGSTSRVQTILLELAQGLASTARRFGFSLRCGIARADRPAPLPVQYRAALSAADKALSEGRSVIYGEPRSEDSAQRLAELRAELARSVGERPGQLSPRFETYIDAVVAHAGYRLETTRVLLAVGFERLVEPLLASGILDAKSLQRLRVSAEDANNSARTVADLVSAYRRLVSQVAEALRAPTSARQERSLERSVAFMREHLSEPLTLERVARSGGFAPDYFSRLFKREHEETFARFLEALRLSHAEQMLKGTMLNVEQVRHLCGFQTRTSFHRAFKRVLGITPMQCRASAVPRLTRAK